MTIPELYILLSPLTQFLGTICLIGLITASVSSAIVWSFRLIWKFVVAAGAIAFFVMVLQIVLQGV